jgi:hypothetical protein
MQCSAFGEVTLTCHITENQDGVRSDRTVHGAYRAGSPVPMRCRQLHISETASGLPARRLLDASHQSAMADVDRRLELVLAGRVVIHDDRAPPGRAAVCRSRVAMVPSLAKKPP